MRYLRLWLELLRLSVRRRPGATAAMLALSAASTVVPAATALALKAAVDASARGAVTAAVAGAAGAGVVYCLATVLQNAREMLRILLVEEVGLTDLDRSIVEDISGIEGIGHLENTEYLDRVTVLARSSWGVMDSLWAVTQSLFGAAEIAVTLLVLGSVSPWLLFLLPFAAVPLWFDRRGRLLVAAAETGSAEDFRLQRHLFEMATSASAGQEIRVAGSAAALAAKQAAAWNSAIRVRLRAQVTAAAWQAGGWTVFAIGFAAGLGLVVWRAGHGHGTVGDVVLTVTVANSLRMAVWGTVSRSAEAAGYRRLLDPLLWLREYAARERELPGGTAPAPARLRDGIVLTDVSYTYPGTRRPAVSGLTVSLPAGAVVAIVGECGSGKTTLVKLLGKFYRPSAGSVTVDGIGLEDLETESWRSRISVAFQDFGRYHTTFREVVGLGDVELLAGPGSGDGVVDSAVDGGEAIARAVAEAGADDLVARLPDGLDTELGGEFGGVELSEGQWHKTALARASMRPAPVLFVLDEPTAALDAPTEHAIFSHYMERARSAGRRAGAITIIVSHRFSTVAGADLILVMDSGTLAEGGTHAELLARGGQYATLYGIQAATYV